MVRLSLRWRAEAVRAFLSIDEGIIENCHAAHGKASMAAKRDRSFNLAQVICRELVYYLITILAESAYRPLLCRL